MIISILVRKETYFCILEKGGNHCCQWVFILGQVNLNLYFNILLLSLEKESILIWHRLSDYIPGYVIRAVVDYKLFSVIWWCAMMVIMEALMVSLSLKTKIYYKKKKYAPNFQSLCQIVKWNMHHELFSLRTEAWNTFMSLKNHRLVMRWLLMENIC